MQLTIAALAALSAGGAYASTARCARAEPAYASLLSSYPSVATDVARAIAAIPTPADECAWPTITGSVGDAASSWSSAIDQWSTDNAKILRSIWQDCSDVPNLASQIAGGKGDSCSSRHAQITSLPGVAPVTSSFKVIPPPSLTSVQSTPAAPGSSTVAASTTAPADTTTSTGASTATSSGTSTPAGASSTAASSTAARPTTNAAARETSLPMVAAAVVVAGFAVAAL